MVIESFSEIYGKTKCQIISEFCDNIRKIAQKGGYPDTEEGRRQMELKMVESFLSGLASDEIAEDILKMDPSKLLSFDEITSKAIQIQLSKQCRKMTSASTIMEITRSYQNAREDQDRILSELKAERAKLQEKISKKCRMLAM